MWARLLASLLLLVAAALLAASCGGDTYNGQCAVGTTCTGQSGGGGACPSAGELRCCPDGGQACGAEALSCRPKEQCDASAFPCMSDEQCPGPPDHRCGVGRCEGGKCELELWAGEPIPNQFPGDCKVTVCSIKGDLVVWTDPGDVPADNNPCTFDACEGDRPVNTAYADTTPCPGGDGVCVQGQCMECYKALGALESCTKMGLYCSKSTCDPVHCVNTEWEPNLGETYKNCGGPDCGPCGIHQYCLEASDCTTGVCTDGECQWATHTDGVKNGDEAGIDCGYPEGPLHTCEDGDTCGSSEHCKSSVCYLGVCQLPTCTDATKNGDETGTDCGGGCEPCQD